MSRHCRKKCAGQKDLEWRAAECKQLLKAYESALRNGHVDRDTAREKLVLLLLAERGLYQATADFLDGAANACGLSLTGRAQRDAVGDVLRGVLKAVRIDIPGLILQTIAKTVELVEAHKVVDPLVTRVAKSVLTGLSDFESTVAVLVKLCAIAAVGPMAVTTAVAPLSGYAAHWVGRVCQLRSTCKKNQAVLFMNQLTLVAERARVMSVRTSQLLTRAAWDLNVPLTSSHSLDLDNSAADRLLNDLDGTRFGIRRTAEG